MNRYGFSNFVFESLKINDEYGKEVEKDEAKNDFNERIGVLTGIM